MRQHELIAPLVACLTFGVTTPIICADEIATPDEMTTVCRNFLSYMVVHQGSWAGSVNPSIVAADAITKADELVGYCFQLSPEGWILISARKQLVPIKACSETGLFDVNDESGLPALIREQLYEASMYVDDSEAGGDAPPLAPSSEAPHLKAARLWDRYVQDPDAFLKSVAAGGRDTIDQIGPLTTARWAGGVPFNLSCPEGHGGQCLVGCVATAMAMIMHARQWPPFGSLSTCRVWDGDNSCGGSTPGKTLCVDFSDDYDWDNMPDFVTDDSPEAAQFAVAELSYEVGVAFGMDYGFCGSAAWMFGATYWMPLYFRYYDSVETHSRVDYLQGQWYSMAREDMLAGRPILYTINNHAVVLDGTRLVDGMYQFHINFGWGGTYNGWYTVDDLFCYMPPCNLEDEHMVRKIIPDREIMFTVDTTVGPAPFTVAFEGSSSLEVDSWSYDFGDGDSSSLQSPVHVYDIGGEYGVNLQVSSGDHIRSLTREKFIYALADTIAAGHVEVAPDSTVEVIIHAANSEPVSRIYIPIDYGGQLELTLDSISTAGCRTDSFEVVHQIHWSPSGLTTYQLVCSAIDPLSELQPGSGPILKVYFSAPANAQIGQSTVLDLGGYLSYDPSFQGSILNHRPAVCNGSVTCASCCVGFRGNVDGDESDQITISDLVHLVDYMFAQGPDPPCWKEADIYYSPQSPGIDISDLIYLVDYMFTGGPTPSPCP